MSFALYPLLPTWLILGAVALAVWLCCRSYNRGRLYLNAPQRRLLLALRLLSVLLLGFILLCPGRVVIDQNLDKSNLAFLLDRSGSMGARDMALGQTRLALGGEFLRENKLAKLADYPKSYYSFNHAATLHRKRGELEKLAADGGTDFDHVFQRLDKDVGLGRTAAVVLVSDGIDFSDFSGEQITVPIYSVQVGTNMKRAKDVGIGQVKCPARVSDKEEVTLDIPLSLSGFATDQQVRLTVHVDDKAILDQELTLTPGKVHHEIVNHVMDQEGVRVVRLGLSRLDDEVSYLNNERELVVEVVKARLEVAAYFPVLTTSFRPLLRELERDEENVFTAVYQVSPGSYRLRGYKLNKAFQQGIPTAPGALRDLTCLILAAHNGELLSPALAQALEGYVSEGGSLILLGGTDSFGELLPGSPLKRLSPVRHLKESSFVTGKFEVKVDNTLENAFGLRIKEIIAANQAAEGFYLVSVNRVQDLKNSAQALLWADDGTLRPLLVWQPFGRGKVIALLTNSLHLWGGVEMRRDNYGSFWRQLISFSRNLDEESDLLKVSLNKSELAPEETLKVTATARRPEGEAGGEITVTAEVYERQGQEAVRSVVMTKMLETYNAEFRDLAPGRYILKVTAQDETAVLRERHKFILVGEIIREKSQLQVETERFRRYSSERHIYQLDEVDKLEEDLMQVVRKNEVRREKFLVFENPAFFLLLLALLLCEWYMRRRFNLF